MSASTFHQIENAARACRRRAVQLPALLLLLSVLVWIPLHYALLTAIASGAALGLISGYNLARAQRLLGRKGHVRNAEIYTAGLPGDTEIRDTSLLAYGMPLLRYQEGLERFLERHGYEERSVEAESAFIETQLDRMQALHLSSDLQTRHLGLIGSTGVGKTETILSVINTSVSRGGGCIVLNAKGDLGFLQRVRQIAHHYGREDDLRILSFEHPEISHTYNPVLNGGHVRATVSTTMKLNANTKEEFFRDMNRSALVAAIACLHGQPDRPAFHFGDLGVLFNDIHEFHKLYDNIPAENTKLREFVWQFLKGFTGKDRDGRPIYNTDKYHTFLQGLTRKMMDFSHSEYAELVCTYSPDIEMYDAIVNNRILVMSMPALLDKEGLQLFGKLTYADIARAIGEIQASGMRPHVTCPIIGEEYGSFKDPTHQELFQLARDANVQLVLSIQGKGFLEDEDRAFADNLLTNTWHQIFFYTKDQDTIEHAQNQSATVLREFRQVGTSSGFASSHSSDHGGAIRQENTSESVSSGTREMRETLIQPDDLTNLDRGDAILIGVGGTYRVRMPILDFPDDPPPIDKASVPRIDRPRVRGLNLLQQAHNRDKNLIRELGRH